MFEWKIINFLPLLLADSLRKLIITIIMFINEWYSFLCLHNSNTILNGIIIISQFINHYPNLLTNTLTYKNTKTLKNNQQYDFIQRFNTYNKLILMTESTKKFIDLAYKNGQPEKLQQQLTVIKQQEGILPVKTHASIFANKSIIIKDKDHTIRNILIFLFFSLIMIFCIDIRSAIHSELNRLKIQTMHCHQEYIENQCEIAVDAIRDKCKELLQCSHRVAQNEIKITQISGKLLGKAIHGIIDNTNLTGLIFLIIMILTIILLAYKSSKAEVKITEKHE